MGFLRVKELLGGLSPCWGKVAGGVSGLWLGDWPGLVLGLLLGHLFDQRLRLAPFSLKVWEGSAFAERDRVLLTATFSLLGHVAKADGRVSEQEVAATESVMRELGVESRWRQGAIILFKRGKRADYPLRPLLQRLRASLGASSEGAERFLGYQLRIAFADGPPSPAQQRLIDQAARLLGLPRDRYESLLRKRYERDTQSGSRTLRPPLQSAYALLGVSERASEEEIKRAYRRSISRHHPDRLLARGVPEDEVRQAARRTQEVRAAYDEIRRLRGF
jgi:DnaJ like chaperone protein